MANSVTAVEIRIVDDADAVAVYAAELIRVELAAAVAARGRASVVLAGGSTPRPAYERLEAFEGIDEVDWLLGDERLVSPGSSESNRRMVEEALLDRLSIAGGRRYLPDLESMAEETVADYQQRVQGVLGVDADGRFDLLLLGMGEDGHTASLFPGDADRQAGGIVAPATAPDPPRQRLTLTAGTLNRTRLALFLVTGAGKAETLASVLLPTVNEQLPATWIRPPEGRVLWVVDKAAAARLG